MDLDSPDSPSEMVAAPLALLVEALSFFIPVISLMLIRTPEALTASSISLRNAWREVSEGLQVIFRNRYLWSFAGETAA